MTEDFIIMPKSADKKEDKSITMTIRLDLFDTIRMTGEENGRVSN